MNNYLRNYKSGMAKLNPRPDFTSRTLELLHDVPAQDNERFKSYRNAFSATYDVPAQFQRRVHSLRRLLRTAASFACIIFFGCSSAVFASRLGLSQILEQYFKDPVSASKIATDQYLPLAQSLSQDGMTLSIHSAVGDDQDCYLLLETTLPTEWIPAADTSVRVSLKTYDSTVDSADYSYTICQAYPLDDSDDKNTYMIEYPIPITWAMNSKQNDTPLLVKAGCVMIDSAAARVTQRHWLHDMIFTVSLADLPMTSSTRLESGQELVCGDRIVTVDAVTLSDYNTRVQFHFPATSDTDAENFWDMYLLDQHCNALSDYALTPNKTYIKVFRNEELLPYSDDCRIYMPGLDPDTGTYSCNLILDAIDLEADDSLTIQYNDQSILIPH